MNNNRKRQSQSAERINQQSSIKVQSEQKNAFPLDPANEMEYIDEILTFLARINRTQYHEPAQLRHALRTSNPVYANLLAIIIEQLDPYLEFKNFTDEKFYVFLKKLGYPCKHMSKTRLMSLGSTHTYLQSLHLLSWLSKQAQQTLTINERIGSGQYQAIEIENESYQGKLSKQLAEFLYEGYGGQSDDQYIEKVYRDAKQKLTINLTYIQKDISKLTCDLNLLKTQEPNVYDLEEQYKILENELQQIIQETQENQRILEQTRQEINQNMNKQLEVDNEIIKIHRLIDQKRQYISQQPIKIDKAKEMESKDYQLTVQSQLLLNDLQKIQQDLDKVRQEKTQQLCKISSFIQQLNQGKIKFEKDFESFDKQIFQQLQRINQNNGIQIGEDENLMDMEIDLQQEMSDSINMKERKSLANFELIQKRDHESILKILLPNKEQIINEFNIQLQELQNKLLISKNKIQELQTQLKKQLKQLEDIECAKKMIIQEVSQLTDSTEELKVLKQIYSEHQEKQQVLLKEIEQKKLEIKFLIDRKNLDQIEIDRLKKQNQDYQETIMNMQQQAELIEEKNTALQNQFKEWVKDNLDQFLQFVQQNF